MSGSRILMLSLSVALLAALAVEPAVAVQSKRAECRRLTRQIDHFRDVATMAAERGDEPWFDGTVDHIRRLGGRRERLCPEYREPNYTAIYAMWTKELVKRAAQAFLSYTTFGAF